MKTIVTMGRGGTGKTSFVALMAKYLIEKQAVPILLVDADPDQNLAEMVGVDLETAGKKTIAELLSETFIERGGTMAGVAPSKRIESRLWEEGLYEGGNFDLLAVGTKWVEGCYCLPDAALKNALVTITRQYRFILIDSPGGLEHLNRKIANDVDVVLDVMGPSSKSFAHVRRAYRVIQETGIRFGRFIVLGGYAFTPGLDNRVAAETGLPYGGKIAEDPYIAEHVLAGRSLLDTPKDSPAFKSVSKILESVLADM
ncbi:MULTISPECIES: AAA family ATPase [unclassified Methanoregula]|uniref:ATP-binding protein n=1 Tax=unclassified Methanoregula TaxID=2649730 RepID=UPI0009CF3DEF|nr:MULTISPECIES: AAA family ATPase [unclassified Methanoregula]OPX63053.1 MAG: CobQ/CobB/MinD/ParA nucleotide binding domain protein [Methanoregula sp. PtaB.Bin085]OPY32328.1 MAG: CobQ/CobB/MinD/ParA nucleotide binding domain protein [Methanoregula sp. PtaU1.Bin006]